MRLRWPLVLRSTYDAVRTENYTLRDALREANKELRHHRLLIAGIKSGRIDMINHLDRIAKKAAS